MVDVSDRATAREEELREDALQAWRRRRDAACSQLGAQACDQCGTPIPEARRLIVPGRGDFLLVPLKAIVLGFTIGVVCCHTALTHSREATRVVASGFVRSALAVLAMSGLLSLVV